MKYSFALPLLALASSALAAPAVVYETQIEYVTGEATTTTTPPSSSSAEAVVPRVDNVVQIVVSEVVIVSGTVTTTSYGTYTQTPSVQPSAAVAPTSATAAAAVSVENKPTTTLEQAQTTPSATTTFQSSAAAPTTTSTQAPTTAEASTTSTSEKPSPTTQQQTTTTSSDDSSSTDDVSASFLKAHNDYRAKHGAVALTWSSELASYAQNYADAYDCSGSLVHSGGPYGENLGAGYTGTGAVDAWYNEISDYDASNPTASHFTQVVWKATTQLGCAIKTCDNIWRQYTICSYNTPGNVAGEYSSNVQV